MATYPELVSIIGKDATLRLMSKFGGHAVSIPGVSCTITSKQVLTQIIKLYQVGNDVESIASTTRLEIATVIDLLESHLTFGLKA